MKSRVIQILVLDNFLLYADDTVNYKNLALNVPELDGLLPHAEDVWVEWVLTECSANELDWNLVAFVGYDRDHELAGQTLFAADQSAVGPQRAAAANLTNPGLYRRHARLELKSKLHAGVAAPKQGRLSAVLFVKTFGV